MSVRQEKNEAAAKLIKLVTDSPAVATEILQNWKDSAVDKNKNKKYIVEEALGLFVNNNFSKRQYIIISRSAKNLGMNIYPSYDQLIIAKKSTYPHMITISDTLCEVPFQALLLFMQ